MAVTSPNMFMTIPTVGSTIGPDYALNINADLSLIDAHDHSLGRGVQITPAGININNDFSLNSNDLTNTGGIGFTALGSNPTNIQFLYVSPGVETPLTEDLWFNDGNGNQVQITNNGLVNATIASLPGQSYAAGTFFWKQGAGSTTPANFDIGSITIRPNVPATTFGVRLTPPAGITSQYDIALPLLPSVNNLMFIDNSGTITTQQFITNTNIDVNSINGNKITDNTITGIKLVDHTVGLTQLATTVLQWNTSTFIITTPAFNVRVATTVNGTIGTAFDNGSPLDGVTLATNDIILVKNQSVTTENGVYIVQASGTPVRHPNYDTAAELNYAGVHVTAGTININTNWFQNDILTTLADPQLWSQSSTMSFTVPTNVNQIFVKAIGGGGGGGGGRPTNGIVGAGGGGAGAHGLDTMPVTAGETLSVTVGFRGTGGTAGTSGSNGQNTSVIGSLTTLAYLGGGGGGAGGDGITPISGTKGGDSVAQGGMAFTSTTSSTNFGVSSGGGGGSNGPGGAGVGSSVAPVDGGSAQAANAGSNGGGGGGGRTPGGAGGGSYFVIARSSGGASQGGGGGGSGFSVGGNGGTAASGGSAAPVADSGAGGGGGGANNTTGGLGSNGKVTILWLGAP